MPGICTTITNKRRSGRRERVWYSRARVSHRIARNLAGVVGADGIVGTDYLECETWQQWLEPVTLPNILS